jgi:WD40 repeat protein
MFIDKHNLLKNIALLIALITFSGGVLQPVFAFTMAEAKEVQRKAKLSQEKLRMALEDGKDVSEVIPMMKRVKVLGDDKKIKQASVLLDHILIKFVQLYQSEDVDSTQIFRNPRKVEIIGMEFGAMEPFISRDGKYLFFNSVKEHTPETDKDIYYAERIDDLTFRFMGEVEGINSNVVDGVPSMDREGNFYYVSVKNYNKRHDFATVYRGKFKDGRVTDVQAIPELSLQIPGWLNMDIEISADGKTIYSTQTYFGDGAPPTKSYFFSATYTDGKYIVDNNSHDIFKNINTNDLEYAASISSDGLELLFTRGSGFRSSPKFESFRATRPDINVPFGDPEPIKAITGFAEAPVITDNGRLIYYHKKNKGRFYIYALERIPE